MKHKVKRLLPSIALMLGLALSALAYVASAEAKEAPKMHKVVFEMSVDGMPKWK